MNPAQGETKRDRVFTPAAPIYSTAGDKQVGSATVRFLIHLVGFCPQPTQVGGLGEVSGEKTSRVRSAFY
jgi:hypothetical protein